MNRVLNKTVTPNVTQDEFTIFIQILIWLAFYGISPRAAYTMTSSYVHLLPLCMALPRSRFYKILDGFSCSDEHNGTSWESYYSPCNDMTELSAMFSKQWVAMSFVEGTTDIIADDDKMRNRSKKANQSGWSRRKYGSVFGPTNNILCSMTSGMPLAAHMSHFGEAPLDILQICLQLITGNNLARNIRLPGTTLGCDRGYNDEECIQSFVNMQLNFMNTVKRSPTLPYSFGNTGYTCTREQKVIPETGPLSVFPAVRKIGRNQYLQFTGFRSGTGRVTFLQSNNDTLQAEKFAFIPRSPSELVQYIDPAPVDLFCPKGYKESILE